MAGTVMDFGTTRDGRRVQAVDLHGSALRARILTYGATLQDLRLAGTPWPLTLGSDRLAAYEGPLRYAGAVVGPVANRIAGGAAIIGGQTCTFDRNEPQATLHGGSTGTSAQIWQIEEASDSTVTLALDLPDGLGGFPGNRRLSTTYRLDGDALELTLGATSDAPTLFNLAHHSYWALDGRATTEGQILTVAADRYLPVDTDKLPTGSVAGVAGTVFDLRQGTRLGQTPQFDINLCPADAPGPLRKVATLRGATGVTMTLETTAPGLQVYDGAGLDGGHFPGLTGQPIGPFAGIALEPQLWPDACHHPGFPSHLFENGETFRQVTRYRFTRTPI